MTNALPSCRYARAAMGSPARRFLSASFSALSRSSSDFRSSSAIAIYCRSFGRTMSKDVEMRMRRLPKRAKPVSTT
jgi:hypothetical protein